MYKNIWSLQLCYLNSTLVFVFMLDLCLASDESEMLADIAAAIESRQVDSSEGSMKFEAVQTASQIDQGIKTVYKGKVSWQFPRIRWDFTQHTLESGHLSDGLRKSIIDDGKQVIMYSHLTKKLYISPDRSRTYPNAIRLAPWQIGSEVLCQVPFGVLLTDKEIQWRIISDSLLEGSKGDSTLLLEVNKDMLPVKLTGRGVASSYDQVMRWERVDATHFLKSYSQVSGTTPEALGKLPELTVSTREWHVDCNLKAIDFTADAFADEDVYSVIKLVLGRKPDVRVLKELDDQYYIELLIKKARNSGFGSSK